ncbi:MAG: hypothetical protein AAB344_05865 [Bacteroidota bacterium]
MKFPVQIPDIEFWKNLVPCQIGCPIHTDAGRYVQLIAEKKYEEAYLTARSPNPFASVCGRVCAARRGGPRPTRSRPVATLRRDPRRDPQSRARRPSAPGGESGARTVRGRTSPFHPCSSSSSRLPGSIQARSFLTA